MLWKLLIEAADILYPDKLGFLFYFQPTNVEEIANLLIQNEFDYPVYIDKNNKINQLNHFPTEPQYQCFLLDANNAELGINLQSKERLS